MLKNFSAKTLAVSMALLISITATSSVCATDYLVDKTIAIAGDEAILFSDLNHEIIKFKNYLQSKGAEIPPADILKKNVLDQLITRRLIIQLAEKNNITLSDSELDMAISHIAASHHVTVEQLMNQYRKTGLSDAAIRESIKNDIIVEEVKRSQVRSRIHISEQEVDQLAHLLKEQAAHMLTYHLAVISISLPVTPNPAQTDAANRKVNLILKELKEGQPFVKVAQKYSEANNALSGGDMGRLTIDEIPEYASIAVSRANAGDVIGPIKTDMGLNIIKVYDIAKMAPEPIEQVKVRHILLKTNIIFDDDAAQKRLASFRNEIINGSRKFDDTARVYSEDPVSSYNGGAMDWMNPDVFDPRFRAAIKNTGIGEITEPFKSSFGWHIAEVMDRKIDKDSIEAYKIKAREILSNRTLMEESERWEREIRDSSYIKILED